MKRTAMAAACAFALAGAAFAQDQEYSAYHTGGSAPTIDANLNDWSGVPEGVALTEFREHGGGKWNGEDDASGTFWLLWNENGLYFAADITDDSHLNKGVGGGIWNGDGAQVAIDPTAERAGGNNMYEFNFGLGGPNSDSPQFSRALKFSTGPAAVGITADDYAIARIEGEKRTLYEVFFPAAAIAPTALEAGGSIGLGMIVNDGDDEPGQQGQKGWLGWGANSIVFGKDTGQMNVVNFVGTPASVDPSGKMASSWGTLKTR